MSISTPAMSSSIHRAGLGRQIVSCRCIPLGCRAFTQSLSQRGVSRMCHLQIFCAKKKGKQKKGGQKKGPGSLMDIPKEKAAETILEPWQETDVIMGNLLLIESFNRIVGRPLLEGDVEMEDIAAELWSAPFLLLAHEVPDPEDPDSPSEPVFSYANKVALDLFEAEWAELIGQPSTISADEEAQGSRLEALDGALKAGKVEGHTGWRRSIKGKRFQLQDVTLFNINSPTGPGAPLDVSKPTADDISAAEAAVQEQATKVRSLKEGGGLTNEDSAVKDAVAELLQLKERLEKLQRDVAIMEQVAA